MVPTVIHRTKTIVYGRDEKDEKKNMNLNVRKSGRQTTAQFTRNRIMGIATESCLRSPKFNHFTGHRK